MQVSVYLRTSAGETREDAASVGEAIELLEFLRSVGWQSVGIHLGGTLFNERIFFSTIDQAVSRLIDEARKQTLMASATVAALFE
jgi:hypothetical protein